MMMYTLLVRLDSSNFICKTLENHTIITKLYNCLHIINYFDYYNESLLILSE